MQTLLILPFTAIPASQIVSSLLLGGLLGATGQGIRAIVGIKKQREEKAAGVRNTEFSQGRLLATIAIGFVAGVLATLPFFGSNVSESGLLTEEPKWTQQVILTLIAAGYSGGDFIEGFLKNYLPKK